MARTLLLSILAIPCLLLGGCRHSIENRLAYAEQITAPAGWGEHLLDGGAFHLAARWPQQQEKTQTLYIYIEGDGLAWRDRSTPSLNPTPVKPVALELALQQGANAAYLARPCQYGGINDAACTDNRWWTSHRFAPEVIDATNRAIDEIRRAHGAQHLVLIGYSGGGAVAALVAARRTDVAGLVTVAGNLDTDAWTHLHKVRALSGSLNPADQWQALQDIPQHHYAGEDDRIVPPAVARSYAARFPVDKRPAVTVLNGHDHACCWTGSWKTILGTIFRKQG